MLPDHRSDMLFTFIAILIAFAPCFVDSEGCSTVRVNGFQQNTHLDGKYRVESSGCGKHQFDNHQREVYTKSHGDDDSDNGGKSSHEQSKEVQHIVAGSRQSVEGEDDAEMQAGGDSSSDHTPGKPSEKLFLFFDETGSGWHISSQSCNLSGAVARVIDNAMSPDAVQTTWEERTPPHDWVDVESTNVKCETNDDDVDNVAAIVLGVIAGLVVLLIIILLVTYCVKKRRVNPVAVYGYENKAPVKKEVPQQSAVGQPTTGPASDVPPYEMAATAPPAYADVLRYPQPPDYSSSSNVRY
jgi:hypothetical protein